MLSIEHAKPTAKKIQDHLEAFEKFCMGEHKLHPAKFRDINSELSICAVLLIGRRRYQTTNNYRHLIWIGPDNQEHDLGRADDINVMRDYPGFHASRTQALGAEDIAETRFLESPKGGSLCEVIMNDGTKAIGPNYRMALRNAVLKRVLKSQFNSMSLTSLWNGIWGHA
jgi:hypothetical protein